MWVLFNYIVSSFTPFGVAQAGGYMTDHLWDLVKTSEILKVG